MTKSDDKRVPALRFKGFTDEWEQRKLGDYGSVAMNKRIFKNQTNTNSGVPFYKIGTFGKKADAFISKKLFEEYRKKYPYPKKGDLLISASGSIGRVIEYTGQQAYYQDSNIVWLNHNDNLENIYLKAYYQIIHWSGIEGSTIKRLYNKNILNTKIYVPIKDEQFKVGTIIDQIEKLITLQQRKLRQLKLLKNALLKRMFTAKKSPTLRFRDFSKDWKLHKLQDITDRLDNARVPVTASKRIAGSTPYYGANGIQDYVKGYTHDGEFLLVAEDGANNINDYPVICAKGKIWVNNHTHVLQAKNKKIDILFLMYALKFLNMKKYLVGGGRSKLNAETMMKLALKLPELDEEHNIGVLIKNMDVLITQYKYRIQKINKFKQFLLQNMFI